MTILDDKLSHHSERQNTSGGGGVTRGWPKPLLEQRSQCVCSLALSPGSSVSLCPIPYLTPTERIERGDRALGTPTRKDRKTVLALTAKERTAAAEQTTRSDRRTSFWKEKVGCEVRSVWLPQQPSAGESAVGHQPATPTLQKHGAVPSSLTGFPWGHPGRARPVWCW